MAVHARPGPALPARQPGGRLRLDRPAEAAVVYADPDVSCSLFDRAAARDLADVRLLARRFGKDVLLARAAQIDVGFDIGTLAGMISTLDRFADDEIPVPEGSSVAELRAVYAAWRARQDSNPRPAA